MFCSFLANGPKKEATGDRVVTLLIKSVLSLRSGFLLTIALTLHGQTHLYSFLQDAWRNPASYAIFYLLEAVPISRLANLTIYLMVQGYTYFKCTNNLLRVAANLLVHGHFVDALHVYRQLTVLNVSFNNSFGRVFIPLTKTTLEFMSPVVIFLSVRVHDEMAVHPLLAFFPALGALTFLYTILFVFTLSDVNKKSAEFLAVWSRSPNKDALKRQYRRSCQMLRCQVGSMYYIDRPMTLNVLKYLIDMLIFLLLNY